MGGNQQDGYFSSYPSVSFSTEDYSGLGIKSTYYSINQGVDWVIFREAFILDSEGIITILFRTEDNAGNLEVTNSQVARVDTMGKWKDTTKVVNSAFATNTN